MDSIRILSKLRNIHKKEVRQHLAVRTSFISGFSDGKDHQSQGAAALRHEDLIDSETVSGSE